jgi:hypothetical protein
MADHSISMPPGLVLVSQREVKSTERPGAGAADELSEPSRIELSDSQEDQKTSNPDDKEEEGIPCPCGDEAHNNLGEWYKEYLASSAGEKVPFNDKFDKATFEENIGKLLPKSQYPTNIVPLVKTCSINDQKSSKRCQNIVPVRLVLGNHTNSRISKTLSNSRLEIGMDAGYVRFSYSVRLRGAILLNCGIGPTID